MDTRQVSEIHIGIRRERLEKLVQELQDGLRATADGRHFDIEIYDGLPNGVGADEIVFVFSNDDMEEEVNPDIDGSKLYVDFGER